MPQLLEASTQSFAGLSVSSSSVEASRETEVVSESAGMGLIMLDKGQSIELISQR